MTLPTVVRIRTGHVETTHPRSGQKRAAPTPTPESVRKLVAQFADLPAGTPDETDPEYLKARIQALEADRDKMIDSLRGQNTDAQKERAREYTEAVELLTTSRDTWKKLAGDLDRKVRDLETDNETLSEVVEEMVATLDSVQEKISTLQTDIDHDIGEPLLALRNLYVNRLQDQEDASPAATVATPTAHNRGNAGRVSPPALSRTNGYDPALDVDDEPLPLDGISRAGGRDPGMPPMIRAFLTVLAQHTTGPRCRPLTKKQLLVYAGYAKSGPVSKAFAEIERQGWWARGSGEGFVITDAGLKALGPFEPLPKREKLRQKIASELAPMERAIFETVCAQYPRGITKKEILSITKYAKSGPVSKAFAYLVARDWLVKEGAARLVASKELFE